MRSPSKSATVTPRRVKRPPVGSITTSSSTTKGPEWVAVAIHSTHAWSSPTSSGVTSRSMSENASWRSSSSTASSAADDTVITGDQPCTSSAYRSRTTRLSPATVASIACTNTAARSALDPITPPFARCANDSKSEQLRLRGRELLVGQRARLVQLGQPLQLGRRVTRRGGRRRRRCLRGRCLRLRVGGLCLLVVLVLLRATLTGLVGNGRRRRSRRHSHQRPPRPEHHSHCCLLGPGRAPLRTIRRAPMWVIIRKG